MVSITGIKRFHHPVVGPGPANLEPWLAARQNPAHPRADALAEARAAA